MRLVHNHLSFQYMAEDPIRIHYMLIFLHMFLTAKDVFCAWICFVKRLHLFSRKRDNITMNIFLSWGMYWNIAIDDYNYKNRLLEWVTHFD